MEAKTESVGNESENEIANKNEENEKYPGPGPVF
jgi:hypothetical protein